MIEFYEVQQAQGNQQEEKMVSADALRNQIKKIRKCFRSENSDYTTGYISALSIVEGLIAYLANPSETPELSEKPCGGNFFEDKTESGLLEE